MALLDRTASIENKVTMPTPPTQAMKGNVVYRQSGMKSDETIDVTTLPNGHYLLSVVDGARRHTKVITISHLL